MPTDSQRNARCLCAGEQRRARRARRGGARRGRPAGHRAHRTVRRVRGKSLGSRRARLSDQAGGDPFARGAGARCASGSTDDRATTCLGRPTAAARRRGRRAGHRWR